MTEPTGGNPAGASDGLATGEVLAAPDFTAPSRPADQVVPRTSLAPPAPAPATAEPAPVGPPADPPPAEPRGSAIPAAPPASTVPATKPKRRARKVRRVIRHVSVYSVTKFAVIFMLSAYLVFLVAGALLWNIALNTSQVENLESFIADLFKYDSFDINTSTILRAMVIGGFVLAASVAILTILLAVVFNLVSDIIGGIRITVLEELPPARPSGPAPAPPSAPPPSQPS